MSINPEDFSKVLDNLQEQRNRIIEIIGLDLIVSDQYGRCLLFNENIKHDTPDEDITKIYKQFEQNLIEIELKYSEFGLSLNSVYFTDIELTRYLNYPIKVFEKHLGLEGIIDQHIKIQTQYNRAIKNFKHLEKNILNHII